MGTRRRGSRSKPESPTEQLGRILDETWPEKDRKAIIESMIQEAKSGKVTPFRLLMAYRYGSPPSGDDLRIQEAVQEAIEDLYETLEKGLSRAAWDEVAGFLGLEPGSRKAPKRHEGANSSANIELS